MTSSRGITTILLSQSFISHFTVYPIKSRALIILTLDMYYSVFPIKLAGDDL